MRGWSLAEADEELCSLPAQHLAAQQTYNHLDISVGEALRRRTLCLEGVLSCQPHETLGEVIDRIAREQVPHTPSDTLPTRGASLLMSSSSLLYPSGTCPILPSHGQALGVHTDRRRVLSLGPSGQGPQPVTTPGQAELLLTGRH